MSSTRAVADINAESHPEYHKGNAEDYYIEGYDPVSLAAPHSSLLKSVTWVGMGLVMAALAGLGIMLWAGAQMTAGTGVADHDPMTFMIIGAVIAAALFIIGFVMIGIGRRDYKAYQKRTGRMN